MKKLIILILIMLITVFSLIACQPTPENSPVVNKEDIYKLAKENTVDFQSFQHDDYINEEVDTRINGLTIRINSKIEMPNTQQFPVISTKPSRFSEEKIKEILDYFAPDVKFYRNAYQITKTQLIDQLLAYSQQGFYSESESEKAKNITEDERLETIEDYKKNITEVPDISERTYVNFAAIVNNDTMDFYDVENGLPIGIEYGINSDAIISVTNTGNGSYTSSLIFDRGGVVQPDSMLQEDDQCVGDVNIVQSEAKEKARNVIEDLGIDGMILASIEKARKLDRFNSRIISKGYYCIYMRRIGEMNTIDIGTSVSVNTGNNIEYVPPWQQEKIYIFVGEEDIESFYWVGLSEIDETISNNVALLPFDDVKQRMRKQLKYKYAWTANIEDSKMDINVNQIVFGIALIGTKNKPNIGILVPAWYIMYNISFDNIDSNDVMVLNAIDGSVIEPRLDASIFR